MIRKYLLIIPCSKRKKKITEDRLHALYLYDGPFYRIIRKFFREYGIPKNLDITIISAKYGLINANTYIAYYDNRMTKEAIKNFAGRLKSRLISIINEENYTEIFQNIGKNYYKVIKGWEMCIDENIQVISAEGGIGQRAKQMRNWLTLRFM